MVGAAASSSISYVAALWASFAATAPVRQFQLLYCSWLVLTLSFNLRHHVRFYDWFSSSGLSLAKRRGLGAHPGKLYGVITPPCLTPLQLRLAGVSLIGCLAASIPQVAPRVFLFLSFLLSLLYFPQLFAECTISGHSTIVVPSVLFLLTCAPCLDHELESHSEWPLTLIRIYLSSGYFASGMCKLLCGIRFGRFWGSGTTLGSYIFDGMWSRPAGPVVRALQEFIILRPRVSSILATGAMVLEIAFVLAPTNDNISVFIGVNGLIFHAGILVLQGLDFVSYWSPCLLVFLVGIPSSEPWTAVLNGLEHETGFFIPAAIYTALQVFTAVTLRDFWLDDVLPFSCCPMFMLPRNIYDDWPKWFTMTDSPINGSCTRQAGAMEPLYWSPVSPVFYMSVEETKLLPQKVVWFGSTTGCPPEIRKFVVPECQDQPFVLFSNFELSKELNDALRLVMAELTCGRPDHGWDRSRLKGLLLLQQQTLQAFDECAAASHRADAAATQPVEHKKSS